MELRSLMKEWRMWVLAIFLIVSVVGLQPTYEKTDTGYDLEFTGLQDNKGIDFSGGSRILLKVQANNTSKESVEEIAKILRRRVTEMDIADTTVNTVNLGDEHRIRITTAEKNNSRLKDLISRQGAFESRMPFLVQGSRNFTIDSTWNFKRNNSNIIITEYKGGRTTGYNKTLEEGDRIVLDNTTFKFKNQTATKARMQVIVYDNTDILKVETTESAVRGGRGRFTGYIPLLLSSDSAERFKKIAQNYEAEPGEEGSLLLQNNRPAMLDIYIDEDRVSGFTVSKSFQTQVIDNPQITITRETGTAARQEMNRIEALLQSGKLPEPVKIVSISTLSSSLGSEFMAASILSIIGSLIAVGFLVFVRYRNAKLVLPIVLTGASEVFILIGTWFSTVATLNLAAIAGIIAAVGTGVDDQIIITDESGREKVKDWKKRMKTAFFVIFTSAASTIGAMLPILSPQFATLAIGAAGVGLIGYAKYSRKASNHYIAIGAMGVAIAAVASTMNLSAEALQQIHEFASTTILGILVGIAITRPAYAKVLEYMET